MSHLSRLHFLMGGEGEGEGGTRQISKRREKGRGGRYQGGTRTEGKRDNLLPQNAESERRKAKGERMETRWSVRLPKPFVSFFLFGILFLPPGTFLGDAREKVKTSNQGSQIPPPPAVETKNQPPPPPDSIHSSPGNFTDPVGTRGSNPNPIFILNFNILVCWFPSACADR